MRTEAQKPEEIEGAESSPYLRRARKVEVRRSAGRWRRALLWSGAVLLAGGLPLWTAGYVIHLYLTSSPRFTLAEAVTVGGAEHVSREELTEVFAPDLGRSVFSAPLEERRRNLEALPWVKTAHVLRGWPNRLRVAVGERTPVAFARVAGGAEPGTARLWLIDTEGVLLPLPRHGKFPLPVLSGIAESQTQPERQKRVALMLSLLRDLDRETPAHSGEISEVDLSDPTDAAVTVVASGAAVRLHLGRESFLERYKMFLENIEGWREQYGTVRSVDLRFEKQVIVK